MKWNEMTRAASLLQHSLSFRLSLSFLAWVCSFQLPHSNSHNPTQSTHLHPSSFIQSASQSIQFLHILPNTPPSSVQPVQPLHHPRMRSPDSLPKFPEISLPCLALDRGIGSFAVCGVAVFRWMDGGMGDGMDWTGLDWMERMAPVIGTVTVRECARVCWGVLRCGWRMRIGYDSIL